MLFLSVDFGTSAVKMSIIDDNQNILCSGRAEYHYLILPGEKNELRETDLMAAFYQAARQLDPEQKKRVEMLCYDTFSPSLVFMDKEGNLVYPNIITHLDRRSRAQSDYIVNTFGKEKYMNISGIYPFPGGCSAMTLIWFQQNQPDILNRAYAIGHLPTLIHKKFTGKWMVDLVNASMIGMYETTKQSGWSKSLIQEFQMPPHLFMEIRNPGTVYGSLVKEIADNLGVPEGIPVCIGTNDVAAAQLGAGNKKAGGIMNTTGSSEMISILTDVPKTSPDYYLRNAAIPGLWQIYVTTCGGFGVEWFYEQFCRDMSREEFYQFEEKEIDRFLSEENGDVVFDPYLTGDRQSLEKKMGAWRGLSLETTRGQMLTAYLYSIQMVMWDALEKAGEIVRLDNIVKISGGMATKAYLRMKEKAYHGMSFQLVDNCCEIGNVELARYYLENNR